LFMRNHETLESAFSMAAAEMTNLGRDVLESNEDCDSKADWTQTTECDHRLKIQDNSLHIWNSCKQ